MPRIDFYILKGFGAQYQIPFACRLISKIYQQKHRVLAITSSEEEASKLDDSLWTFNDISFIPHERVRNNHPQTPIIIATKDYLSDNNDILLNLTLEINTNRQPFKF